MELSPIAQQIWEQKYRLTDANGYSDERTIEDTWERIAKAIANGDAEAEARFYSALEEYKFLPAGRIIAGAGTGRKVTLFNCYVSPTIDDSLDGIYDAVKSAALTMQQGGGIGMDFSTIRPKGSLVKGVDADASGPLTFMDVWDASCKTIMSAGSRRGAMMATLRVDHPDVLEFIGAKRDPLRFRNFNCSVMLTDKFMEALGNGEDFDLVFDGHTYSTIAAQELWDAIMLSTYAFAEPGVLFIDRINDRNNLNYCETINATNPCGEQPLPPHGACLLGSINLTRFILDPFTSMARFDVALYTKTVGIAVEFLDAVIDVSGFPHDEQRAEAVDKRRIGLGVTGLASALAMMGLKYDSPEGRDMARCFLENLQTNAYLASARLASTKGSFPAFAPEFLETTGFAALPDTVQKAIRETGIRNSLLTSIAPTGTISLLGNNVSSGVEPMFALEYTRKVREPDGGHRFEAVSDYAVRLYREIHDADLPDYFRTAQDMDPMDHVDMQAVVQDHIDSAVSKTINVPEDITFDAFKAVYLMAYKLDCKGCTTYRPNDVTGSVLSVGKEEEEPTHKDASLASPAVRPTSLTGTTYKLRWPDAAHAYYVTINDHIVGGVRLPFEMFVHTKNVEGAALMTGLTRMVSAVFRRGGDLDFVAEELKAVFDPKGGQWLDGKQVPSMLAALGGLLEQHMHGDTGVVAPVVATSNLDTCPACGAHAMVKQEGCVMCTSCGHSACG